MKGFALTITIIFGVLWIVATFEGCQNAMAHPFGGGHRIWSDEKKHAMLKSVIADELNLSENQKSQLDEMLADMGEQHAAMRSAVHGVKAALMAELEKDQVRVEDLRPLFEGLIPVIENMTDAMAEKVAAFHAILTPEQRADLVAHLENAHDRGGACWLGRRFSATNPEKAANKRRDILKYIIATELEFSDDQKAELDRLLADMGTRHEGLRSAAFILKTELISELGKEQVKAEDLKQLFTNRKPILESLADTMAEKIAAFHAMLTPEQRALVLDHIKSRTHDGRYGRPW
jgi:Spy/CpxP family protein refolding chaperone